MTGSFSTVTQDSNGLDSRLNNHSVICYRRLHHVVKGRPRERVTSDHRGPHSSIDYRYVMKFAFHRSSSVQRFFVDRFWSDSFLFAFRSSYQLLSACQWVSHCTRRLHLHCVSPTFNSFYLMLIITNFAIQSSMFYNNCALDYLIQQRPSMASVMSVPSRLIKLNDCRNGSPFSVPCRRSV